MAQSKLKKSTNTTEVEHIVTSNQYTTNIAINEEGETESLKMLAGYTDDDGTLHTAFTLREMTGKDEEAISKGDVKANSSKVVSVLLERCCLSIGTITKKEVGTQKWSEIIKSLFIGDQDYMLIKLRQISVGDEVEVNHKCPKCAQELKTFVSLEELEVEPFKGEVVVPFELPKGYRDKKGVVHKSGVMRLSNGLDREILTPLAKKNLATATSTLLTRVCKFDDGMPITNDIMGDLIIRDREYLQKLMKENEFGLKLDVEVECTSCGESFKGNLSASNFM